MPLKFMIVRYCGVGFLIFFLFFLVLFCCLLVCFVLLKFIFVENILKYSLDRVFNS